jgi:hypothetical protein
MAVQRQRRIVETPTEVRLAEPGPSVLALLAVSTGLAVLILGVVWFAFFALKDEQASGGIVVRSLIALAG